MRLGKVFVSPGFLILVALLLWWDPQGLAEEILFAWVCHEAAHVAVLHVAGGSVDGFRITVNGADIRVEQGRGLSYFGEMLSVLAGPGCNLLLAQLLAQREVWYPAAGVQLAVGVFNLLPFPGLDGNRIFRLLKNLFTEHI